MSKAQVMGVDVGGTHITAALVDLETRSLVPGTYFRGNVNASGTVAEIIQEWSETMLQAKLQYNNSLQIGIAIPGPFDYDAGISYIKDQNMYDALYGLQIKDLLAAYCGCKNQDILLINDASSFLQGEVFGGAAQGCQDVIGITLGTGLGTCRYHGGVAEDANLWCVPFLDGIAEDYLSTRWFIKRYSELTGKIIVGVKELADLVTADARAQQVFEEFGHNLGRFLINFIQTDAPELIVVGEILVKPSICFYQR